jgi:transcriptional regulator with XRE-family HTH domain
VTDNPLAKRVGDTVRQFRNEAGLSQEELADRCEVHRTYIGAVERGEKNVTVKTVKKIASALGLSLKEFFSNLPDA